MQGSPIQQLLFRPVRLMRLIKEVRKIVSVNFFLDCGK